MISGVDCMRGRLPGLLACHLADGLERLQQGWDPLGPVGGDDGDPGRAPQPQGGLVPPDGYLRGLRALCDRYGILLMFDEVMMCAMLRPSMVKFGADKTCAGNVSKRPVFRSTVGCTITRAHEAKAYHRGLMVR